MKRHFGLLIAVFLLLALAVPLAAQEEGQMARMRIGYFSFDPREYDTFIDGELASFSHGWDTAGWLEDSPPGFEGFACCSATPYMDMPSGEHSIAFVPRGEDVDAAILDPQSVTLEPGHIYSLVVVGEIGDGTLELISIDETIVFAVADQSADYMAIDVHDLDGVAEVSVRTGRSAEPDIVPYGSYRSGWQPAGNMIFPVWTAAGDQTAELVSFPTMSRYFALPGVSNLSGLIGTYPGTFGEDYFLAQNLGYQGPMTVVDGGVVAPSDAIRGAIEAVAQRVRYALTIETDQMLNIYANAMGGNRAPGFSSPGPFNPVLYVYAAQGNLLLWNDEFTVHDGNYDAGMEGIALSAGDYFIEVGSYADVYAGPYELVVESAE